ncbi:MAG: DEAD/DEAH box helicase, partial [Kiritimatiellae bacterium]|nr:DEAD/DEAH box helicase [Kiritimatiellia bacterium]
EIDDQTISLAAALGQFKKNRYIALNDGSRAMFNEDYIKSLERIFRRRKKGDSERISFFDLPMLEDMLEESDRLRIDGMKGFAKIKKALTSTKKAPLPKVNAKLRPYQKDGYQWLSRLNKASLGCCLADDMGLGKTLQAIALLKATIKKSSPPSLVVMPRSLIFNWQKEIEKFCPELTFAVHHGPARDLKQVLKSQLVLTTYGTLRSDIELLQDERFHYLILDESQNIKNPASQVARAVLLVNSDHRLALSGTPVENNLTELFSLFRFLNPAMFESLPAFNRNYALPISKDNDQEAMRELQRKIAPFILRRTKKEVLKDLPDKVEQILYVDMSEKQAALYESRRLYYKELIKSDVKANGLNKCQFIILQAFTELRQIASTPASKTDGEVISAKREVVVNELTEATANGHKCLLFANFIGALEGMSDDLNTAGIEHVMMTGATRDRQRLVERFQNDDSVKVFLMTLKTGGVGLNLTAADYVFIYDPWWNLAAETQAVDRTHRIGQKNTVFTYKLVTRNTIEEKILLLQQQKGELFNNLIGADSASLKSFTEADIQFALGVG